MKYLDHPLQFLFLPILSSHYILLIVGALALWVSPGALLAQSLTYTGSKPWVNFGSANLCKPGQFAPAPCSKTLTLEYKVTGGGTLGTPKVLTQGSPDLDFTLANGSTCIGGVTTGETCAVNVTFGPRYAGSVGGAVQVTSETGTVLATTPILGTGTGPQIGTLTNGIVTEYLPWSLPISAEIAIDGAGDVFQVNPYSKPYTLVEQPANGRPNITIPFTYSDGVSESDTTYSVAPINTAIDGAGNVLFLGNSTVGLIPRDGGGAIQLPFEPLVDPWWLAVDGIGDVFVEDSLNSRISKLPAGCHSSSCVVSVLDEHASYGDIGSIAADPSGDLFVQRQFVQGQPKVFEYLAGGGAPLTLSTSFAPALVNGVGEFFAIEETPYPDLYATLSVLPAGSTTPVTLLGGYYENKSVFPAQNLAGDSFLAYSGDGAGAAEYQRSQFAPLDFGSLPVGMTKTLPLAITNTGNQTLLFTPYFVSPTYHILSESPSNCQAGVTAGATCTLQIEFAPLKTGPHTIQLTLKANGAADAVILLEGNGTK